LEQQLLQSNISLLIARTWPSLIAKNIICSSDPGIYFFEIPKNALFTYKTSNLVMGKVKHDYAPSKPNDNKDKHKIELFEMFM
jgi:hypothetical protein